MLSAGNCELSTYWPAGTVITSASAAPFALAAAIAPRSEHAITVQVVPSSGVLTANVSARAVAGISPTATSASARRASKALRETTSAPGVAVLLLRPGDVLLANGDLLVGDEVLDLHHALLDGRGRRRAGV